MDETSTERATAFEDPTGHAAASTGLGGYPSDLQTVSGDLSGPGSTSLDDLADDAPFDLNALAGAPEGGATITALTDAQAAEMRRLHRTRSIECGAMTTTLMCAGCDGAAMDGRGRCQHECHSVHHRYDPDRGIVCGECAGTSGAFGPGPRWWTCGPCELHAPVDDIDLIPGMTGAEDFVVDEATHGPVEIIEVRTQADVDVAYERGVTEGLRRADNAILWGVTCIGCADKLDGLIAERAAGYAEGRLDALTEELAQSEGYAAQLEQLPGQQQAAAFYRLHAEHMHAVLAQEPPTEPNPEETS